MIFVNNPEDVCKYVCELLVDVLFHSGRIVALVHASINVSI